MLSAEARRSFTKYVCRLGQPSTSLPPQSSPPSPATSTTSSTDSAPLRPSGQTRSYSVSVMNKRGKTEIRKTVCGFLWPLLVNGLHCNSSWETGSRQFSRTTGSRTAFYDALEITPQATQAQVKQAFYRLSKLYHPDINKTKEAKDKYPQIVEAYETLGNKRHRRTYDSGIFSSHHGSPEGHHEDPRTYRPEGGFKKRNQAPPTGRSRVYNYDEFYKMHYKEAFQRAKNIRNDKKNEDKRNTAYGSDDSKHLATVAMLFSMVVYVSVISSFRR